MATQCHVGSFNTGTGAASTTVEVNFPAGNQFQPEAILFWWGGGTSATDAVETGGSHFVGMGAATGTTARWAIATVADDATGGNSNTAKRYSDAACVLLSLGNGTGNDGALDLQSFDTDGFTLVVDTQCAVSLRVHYLALAGDATTNAEAGSFTTASATGNAQFSTGFQPEFVMITGTGQINTAPNGGGSAKLSVGMATSTSARGVVYAGSQDNAATTVDARYGYLGEVYVGRDGVTVAGDALRARADFVSFDATPGVTLDYLETGFGGTGHTAFYLALAGGDYLVGDLSTATNTTPFSESGFGFKPAGVFLASHGKTQSTQNTQEDHALLCLGAFSATDARAASCSRSETGISSNSNVTTAVEHDACYVRLDTSTDTVVGVMDVDSIDSGGFTVVMDDADPDAAMVLYAAFGPAAATGGANPKGIFGLPMQGPLRRVVFP